MEQTSAGLTNVGRAQLQNQPSKKDTWLIQNDGLCEGHLWPTPSSESKFSGHEALLWAVRRKEGKIDASWCGREDYIQLPYEG
jgi:hypothetical protein